MIVKGLSDVQIAKKFCVIDTTIRSIRVGKTWKHVPRPSELGDGRRNLLKEEVVDIIKLINSHISDNDIASKYNCNPGKIQDIRLGVSWKKIPR